MSLAGCRVRPVDRGSGMCVCCSSEVLMYGCCICGSGHELMKVVKDRVCNVDGLWAEKWL